jgi:VanZ family protein
LNPSRKQFWKAWIPAIIWLTLIAIESTNLMSASNTSRFLYPIFHFLTGVDPLRFAVWNEYFRKVGHFVGYFVLSWLLFGAWRATLPQLHTTHWSWHWARVAFFMSALVATLDEWHQTHLASRTGNLGDVLLDTSAVLTAQIVIWGIMRTRTPAEQEVAVSNVSS